MKNILFAVLLLLPVVFNAQVLETFAGSGVEGFINGPADQAQFSGPEQMAADLDGNVYICDRANNVIRLIDTNGEVSTFAGTGVAGDVLGPKATALFDRPTGIAIDETGNIYIVDAGNQKIKVIRPDGMVEFIAGDGGEGFADGPVANAQFNFPTHICADQMNNLFVAGNNDSRIRKIDLTTQMVSTYVGSGSQSYQDGPGAVAAFFLPQGVAIDVNNNLYVGDRDNNVIRKVTPEGEVSTLAGTSILGHADGLANQAQFAGPKGVAVDDIGNVYVADRLNFVVRKIDTAGVVTTVAGTPGLSGYADGQVSDITLIGRAVDVIWHPDNYLLISDWENNNIRKLTFDTTPSAVKESVLPENTSISVFPNPTSELVNIKGDLGNHFKVTLFDVDSKRLLQVENEKSFPLINIPTGLYFLEIAGAEYYNIEKIWVK